MLKHVNNNKREINDSNHHDELEDFETFWKILKRCEKIRESFWKIVECFEKDVNECEMFWKILEGIEKFWKKMEDCEKK